MTDDRVVIGGKAKLRNVIKGNTSLQNLLNGSPGVAIRAGAGKGGISNAVKEALLDCFEHVAWVDDDGQVYYQALYDALYAAELVSISALFNQGQAVIYDNDSLDDLKQYLTVTANYDDGTSETVASTDYTLSGTLNPGTSTICVAYEGKMAYFNVTVTHMPGTVTITNTLTGCTNSNSASSATEGDSYSGTITASSGYSLAGATVSVTMGGTDITSTAYNNGTISIAELTGNVVITITAVAVTLVSISAVYTQTETVYDSTALNSLKTDLVVTATYSDSSTATVPSADYTLSGTLAEGTSTVTITYEGKTTTFNVTVTANSIYTLPNTPVTFDGTNYVQTDVKFMETDISFTILMSWKNGDLSAADRPTLFHCQNEGGNPYQGLSLYQNNSGAKPFVLAGQASTATQLTGYSTDENAEIKMIVRHTAGETTYIVDGTSNGVRQTQIVSTRGKNPYLTNAVLWVGRNRQNPRPFYGTVYDWRLKSTVLTDDDVTAYLGS